MSPLLDAIIKHVLSPVASLETPFQMLVSMMERDFILGRILTGRITSGIINIGDSVHGIHSTDVGVQTVEEGRVTTFMKKKGTSMITIDSAGVGDIISMTGLTSSSIGHTVTNMEIMIALPTVELNPPTISMTFGVNDSPLAGRDVTHLTGGRIGDRLMTKAETNLAINVLPGALSESFEVRGRGELQLGILIENIGYLMEILLNVEEHEEHQTKQVDESGKTQWKKQTREHTRFTWFYTIKEIVCTSTGQWDQFFIEEMITQEGFQ